MTANDKLIIFFFLMGLTLFFTGLLAIVIERYQQIANEKRQDQLADEAQIKQKILQLHDYGEFLNQELSTKQEEAKQMYQIFLDQARQLNKTLPLDQDEPGSHNQATKDPKQSWGSLAGKNPLAFMEEDGGPNHNQKIKDLYSQGLSPADIAKQLGIGKGQVELVLRLFSRP